MVNKDVCKRISSMLSLYIDNRVTYPQRAFIEEHLSTCKECYKKYLYLKSLIKDLKDSYKQVLEVAIKKQKQQTFSIREHEKFLSNLSSYIDNELEAKECFEFRKYLIKSKSAQKELKNTYRIQKEMRISFDKRKKEINTDFSITITDKIRNQKNEHSSVLKIAAHKIKPKALKIAILSGLILIGGYEIEQLYEQHKEAQPSIQKESSSELIAKPKAQKSPDSMNSVFPRNFLPF